MQTRESLARYFEEFDSLVVAFSGGVDSSLVAYVAKQVLGARATIVSIENPLSAPQEIAEAHKLSEILALDGTFIALDPRKDERVKNNEALRCYYCKHLLFSEIQSRYPGTVLIDGTNHEDLYDDRPGIQALKELGVRSPLAELGFSKEEVRALASELGLPNAQKPAAPCLATRFEVGSQLDDAQLARIAEAEDSLRKKYAGDFRLRLRNGKLVFELK